MKNWTGVAERERYFIARLWYVIGFGSGCAVMLAVVEISWQAGVRGWLR